MQLQLPTAVRRLERNHALFAETTIIGPSTNLTGTPLKQIRPNLLDARQPLCQASYNLQLAMPDEEDSRDLLIYRQQAGPVIRYFGPAGYQEEYPA
jgi:hypothetical protein